MNSTVAEALSENNTIYKGRCKKHRGTKSQSIYGSINRQSLYIQWIFLSYIMSHRVFNTPNTSTKLGSAEKLVAATITRLTFPNTIKKPSLFSKVIQKRWYDVILDID